MIFEFAFFKGSMRFDTHLALAVRDRCDKDHFEQCSRGFAPLARICLRAKSRGRTLTDIEIAQERIVKAGADLRSRTRMLWWLAVTAGLLLRFAIVAIPGNRLYSPWSGKGDAAAYVLLAQNLASGRGFTYASIPTAFRPPLLPLFLAMLMIFFGAKWVLALRWIQLLLGLGTVYFIYGLSLRMFGEEASKAALLIALFFPTLIYSTSEVLTECASAFLVAAFLLILVRQMEAPNTTKAAQLGVTIGLATLARFNLAALILPATWATLARRNRAGWLARLMIVGGVSLAVLSPWLVRNWTVFGDPLLLGTTDAYAALQAVLQPAGRAQRQETEQKHLSGWLSYDLETNSAARRSLPGELELDQRDWRLARSLWMSKGVGMLPILGEKLAYFWFSTDQLLHANHFSFWPRVLRGAGVLGYWLALILAIAGWSMLLRQDNRPLAWLLLFYTVVLTASLLPFAMNTRLRLPMMDPLIAALAGGGWVRVSNWWAERIRKQA